MAENSTVPVAKTDGALRRVDPIEMFNAIQDDLERFWRDPFRVGALAFPFRRTPKSIASFMPRMDIYEKGRRHRRQGRPPRPQERGCPGRDQRRQQFTNSRRESR